MAALRSNTAARTCVVVGNTTGFDFAALRTANSLVSRVRFSWISLGGARYGGSSAALAGPRAQAPP